MTNLVNKRQRGRPRLLPGQNPHQQAWKALLKECGRIFVEGILVGDGTKKPRTKDEVEVAFKLPKKLLSGIFTGNHPLNPSSAALIVNSIIKFSKPSLEVEKNLRALTAEIAKKEEIAKNADNSIAEKKAKKKQKKTNTIWKFLE